MAISSIRDNDASEQAGQSIWIKILVGDELGQLRGRIQKAKE